MKINQYLAENEALGLREYIALGIVESSGQGLGGSHIETITPNSTFEGMTFFKKIEFTDDGYIIVGHKCHMTLYDEGDRFLVTSLYVHPSNRLNGYAERFLQSLQPNTTKPIIIDTWCKGLFDAINENKHLTMFHQ